MRQAKARGKQEEVLQKQREERQMEKDVQEFFERKKMEATAQKQFLASATKQQVEDYRMDMARKAEAEKQESKKFALMAASAEVADLEAARKKQKDFASQLQDDIKYKQVLKKQQAEEAQRLQQEAKDVMQQRVEKELRQEAKKKA